ncbi:hypothetical protein RRG08_040800 [Elysia crispata]|uniref:Uncharacterized protein n=1 Tax=Elysia crispata TaxID=231223 RepID=A0AAE1BDG5_9GAST|nr:hypothetical protein RRG08_040800 [Elysia crispata]
MLVVPVCFLGSVSLTDGTMSRCHIKMAPFSPATYMYICNEIFPIQCLGATLKWLLSHLPLTCTCAMRSSLYNVEVPH